MTMLKNINRLWCIIEKDFDISKNRLYETLFTTGNGYISIRGSLEEGLNNDPQNISYERRVDNISLEQVRDGKSKWGTYIPWMMAQHPTLGFQMINLPYFSDIVIIADEEKLDLERSNITDYCRWLDMKTGILYRQINWHTKNGAILKILYRRFPHIEMKHLIINSADIECLAGSPTLKISGGIDSDVRTNGFDHFVNTDTSFAGEIMKMRVNTNSGDTINIAGKFLTDSDMHNHHLENRKVSVNYSKKISEGEKHIAIKLCAIFTSKDTGQGKNNDDSAIQFLQNINSSFEQLKSSHVETWQKKWYDADIGIEGDNKSQLAIRFAIYHMIRGCPIGGPPWAIGSRLVSGDLYCGHIFWDNEMFLMPFHLYTNPSSVRDMLFYRYKTLNGSRSKAKRYGYPGAMYAWQSAVDGEENCVAWQYPDLQIHISADVVFGIWHYYSATGDESCLTDFGAEIIFEVARFFAARADKRPYDNFYSLLGVMGPDEYNHFSHNNAYTNFLAKFVFEKAVWTADFLRKKYPEQFNKISNNTGLKSSEINLFSKIGSSLIIPKDKKRKLILQSEDFEKLAPIYLKKVWKDRSKPFGLFMSQERRYRSQVLKQADVLMLMHILPDDFDDDEKKTAFNYYEPKTCHDSSLSYPIHSIIAARIGNIKKAYDYWMKSALLDLEGISHQTSEGLHESSLGGNWQAIIFGFAGMSPAHVSKELKFSPCLPKKWKRLRFRIIWHGNKYEVEIKPTGQRVNLIKSGFSSN